MAVAKLTKSYVESAKPGIYWDQTLKGFGLRVTTMGTKSYVVQRSGAGFKTLGRHPVLTCLRARRR